jgi:phage FluMu protein Com
LETDKEKMTEIRCVKCKRLLFKVGSAQLDGWIIYHIEIKCPKCGFKNHNSLIRSPNKYFDLPKDFEKMKQLINLI